MVTEETVEGLLNHRREGARRAVYHMFMQVQDNKEHGSTGNKQWRADMRHAQCRISKYECTVSYCARLAGHSMLVQHWRLILIRLVIREFRVTPISYWISQFRVILGDQMYCSNNVLGLGAILGVSTTVFHSQMLKHLLALHHSRGKLVAAIIAGSLG